MLHAAYQGCNPSSLRKPTSLADGCGSSCPSIILRNHRLARTIQDARSNLGVHGTIATSEIELECQEGLCSPATNSSSVPHLSLTRCEGSSQQRSLQYQRYTEDRYVLDSVEDHADLAGDRTSRCIFLRHVSSTTQSVAGAEPGHGYVSLSYTRPPNPVDSGYRKPGRCIPSALDFRPVAPQMWSLVEPSLWHENQEMQARRPLPLASAQRASVDSLDIDRSDVLAWRLL